MKNDNSSVDHAQIVLQDAPITIEQKADIWDAVQDSPNADSLVRSLEKFDLPAHLVAALVTAKRLIDAESAPTRADKVKAAAQQMAALDPKLLAVIEKYPSVLKQLLNEPSKKEA